MFDTSGSSAEPGARQVVSPNWLVAACQPMGQTQWPCGVTANGALHATHLLFLWSQRAQCWNLKKHSSCARPAEQCQRWNRDKLLSFARPAERL